MSLLMQFVAGPPTAEAQVTTCGICGEHEVTGTGFSPSIPVFLRPYDSTNAPPRPFIQ